MAIEKLTFLDEVGVQQLAEAVLSKANIRISERIVQEINDQSDADHTPSAALLNTLLKAKDGLIEANKTAIANNKKDIDAVKTDVTDLTTKVGENKTAIDGVKTDLAALDTKIGGLTHLTMEAVTGLITTVTDPKTDVLYLQRDDENDTTWMLYIYTVNGENHEWIAIGDTEIDLSGYWKKTDIDEMKEALGVPEMTPMTEAKIKAAVETAFTNTDFFKQPAQS